jgi:DNA-binding transcriptional ArsR family regulator
MAAEGKHPKTDAKISSLFDLFRQPARIHILLIIREQPACVCHLEAALGLRQASISQHLMILRKAGWVSTRRESRNIYYRLTEPRLIELIEKAAAIQNIDIEELRRISSRPLANCPCPQCHPELPPEYSCKSLPIVLHDQ